MPEIVCDITVWCPMREETVWVRSDCALCPHYIAYTSKAVKAGLVIKIDCGFALGRG